MKPFSPSGLATGIGSLPINDPDEAVEFIGKYLPQIPHWPQMPWRCREEHFIFQFLQVLVDTGLLSPKNDSMIFDTGAKDWPERLTEFYTICFAAQEGDPKAMERFLPSKEGAAGFHHFIHCLEKREYQDAIFFKGQTVGPLTAGLNLTDEKGGLAYFHGDLRDVIVRTIALGAKSQAMALSCMGRPVIIFVDEPAISAYGSKHYLGLGRDLIVEDMNAIFGYIRSAKALCGVHTCDILDWSIPLGCELDILSFDAYSFGDSFVSHGPAIKPFLQGGGILAWGMVPTVDNPFETNTDALFKRLKSLVDYLSGFQIDTGLIYGQSMVTPACGTGCLSLDKTNRIYSLTSALSERLLSFG